MAGYIGSKASVVSSGAERKKTFTITGATTSLTGLNYTVGKVHVFQNGVRLVDGIDYTATNGTTITLTVAAQSGDNVVVVSQASFQLSEHYTSAEADAEFVNDPSSVITVSGSNVGIGTSSPAYSLDAVKAGSNIIRVQNSASSADASFYATNTVGTGIFGMNATGQYMYGLGNFPLLFYANGTERMRIDSSGRLLVGTTTSGGSSGLTIQAGTNGSPAYLQWNKANSPSEGCMVFRFNGAAKGSVTYTSTGTAFNTTSDYRVKENVVNLTGASARLNELGVKRFNFIDDETNTTVDGFLAHEVATVVPEAISGTKDAMMDEEYEVTPAVEATYDEDGNELTAAVEAVMGTRSVPDYQGIDQSKLVPLLTAALQEALTEIASLKTRVEALEA